MKLPNREAAYIPTSKLADYLLSNTHAVGKSKARFFQRFGFNETNVDVLMKELMKIAHGSEVTERE